MGTQQAGCIREVGLISTYRISSLGTQQAGCIREVGLNSTYRISLLGTQQAGCIREVGLNSTYRISSLGTQQAGCIRGVGLNSTYRISLLGTQQAVREVGLIIQVHSYRLSPNKLAVLERGWPDYTWLVPLYLQKCIPHAQVLVRVFDLKNKYQSSAYHYSMDEVSSSSLTLPDMPLSPQCTETNLLTQLSENPHPNIPVLIASFKAKTIEQHELFAQQLNPDNPKKMYTTARVADFMVLQLPRLLLSDYCDTQKQSGNLINRSSDSVPSETIALGVMAQLLLAVGHLINNKISHCAVLSCNVYVDEEDNNTILLSNFSHAVQLNSQKQNLKVIRQAELRLKDDLSKTLHDRNCVLSPEIVEAVDNSDLENAFLHGELQDLFAKNDTYGVARTIYCWLLSNSSHHSFLDQDRVRPYGYDDIPYLSDFSPQLNHLLRKLIAYDHRERLNPIQGALACFVLLFGPRISDIKSEEQCYKWLLAETVEFYMKPVLVDSDRRDCTERFSKLLCIYLTVASSNPKGVWDACRFFSQF